MAKKIAAEKVEPEVIAKCDNLNEVTPNHDEVITSVAQSSPESVSIKSMIRLIRGQQVMLDCLTSTWLFYMVLKQKHSIRLLSVI